MEQKLSSSLPQVPVPSWGEWSPAELTRIKCWKLLNRRRSNFSLICFRLARDDFSVWAVAAGAQRDGEWKWAGGIIHHKTCLPGAAFLGERFWRAKVCLGMYLPLAISGRKMCNHPWLANLKKKPSSFTFWTNCRNRKFEFQSEYNEVRAAAEH